MGRCSATDNLRVEEVPDPDAGSREWRAYRHPIEQPECAPAGAATKQPDCDHDAGDAAVAREATPPDRHDLERMSEVVPRLVQETVT